jgi:hypothetical protein
LAVENVVVCGHASLAPARACYVREFDSPQQRVRDKNPEPFQLP